MPEIDDEAIREIVFHNYRIIYRKEDDDGVLILGIIHVARDLNNVNPHPWEVYDF